MLSFFRRYTNSTTFIILIFVPALLSLGITGALMDVMRDPSDRTVGRVFGEDVSQQQFQKFEQAYLQTNQGADEESAWRFLALMRAAERAGVRVSDAEVGKRILDQSRFPIARFLAQEELQKKGVNPSTPEGREEFQRILFEKLTEAREFDPEVYKRFVAVEQRGASIRQYEEQERREALVSRYLDTVRELGTVEPSAVWEEFQEQHHRRILELVSVEAREHLPALEATDPKARGLVTDAQVRAYYEANQADYDIPRREKLEVVGVELAKLEVSKTDPAAGQEWLDAHRTTAQAELGIADVGTDDFLDLPDESQTKIHEAIDRERRLAKADEVMAVVARAVEAAQKDGGKADLAAICSLAAAETKAPVAYLSTDLVERAWVDEQPLLAGFAARNWFDRKGEVGETSDVLAGDKGWFVVRVNEVQFARTPDYDQVKDQVRRDYALGSEKERRRHYDAFKGTRYAGDAAWRVDAFIAKDAEFGDHDKARAALEALRDEAKVWGAGFDKTKVLGSTKIPTPSKLETPSRDVTKAQMAADPALGALADQVASLAATLTDLSAVVETTDKAGWVVARVMKTIPADVLPYDQVKDKVAEAVRLARGAERARMWAEETLLPELRGLTGEALAKALADRGLVAKKTAPVARDATTIEGISDAGRIVADAFASDAKVGGGFSHVEAAGEATVVLVRVVDKDPAPEDAYAAEYSKLRGELLRRKRGDFAADRTTRLFLEAKGITKAHMDYAVAQRDGAGGVKRLKLRQVFLRPDQATLDGWLDVEARKRLAEAQAELKAGKTFEAIVDKFSEDDATRPRGGRLPPVGRGDLLADFGSDFEEVAFSLPDGGVSDPIKSPRGVHLVKRLGRDGTGTRTLLAHVLVKTDPVARHLPKDVAEKAEALAKARIDEAAKRLEGGAAFGLVARDAGDKDDPNGQGQELSVDYLTPFERAALASLVEWEAPEGSPEAKDLAWVPGVVEVAGPDANVWHLLGCGRDRADRAGGDRTVVHVAAPSREAIEAVRERLAAWMRKQVRNEEDRPSWPAIREQLRDLARDYSKAPDATKGGELGLIQVDGAISAYGPEFLEKVMGATPPTAGQRIGPFRGATGWHLVEVVEVEKAGAERFNEVANLVLRGTDWR